MLRPRVFPDHERASQHVAEWLVEHLRHKPNAVVCLATGATPMRAYTLFAERAVNERSLVDRCRLVKLDEWGGLPMDDPATCEQHLRSTLVAPLRMTDRYIGFESQPANAEAECVRVAKWLDENGPIDLCVLGLGVNGHIGFNEPAAFLQPHAHVARLADATLAHSMVKHCDTRPKYGLTLGMVDLLRSRHILMLVTGASKRRPLERLISRRITTEFPASLLQLHGDVQLICDTATIDGC